MSFYYSFHWVGIVIFELWIFILMHNGNFVSSWRIQFASQWHYLLLSRWHFKQRISNHKSLVHNLWMQSIKSNSFFLDFYYDHWYQKGRLIVTPACRVNIIETISQFVCVYVHLSKVIWLNLYEKITAYENPSLAVTYPNSKIKVQPRMYFFFVYNIAIVTSWILFRTRRMLCENIKNA